LEKSKLNIKLTDITEPIIDFAMIGKQLYYGLQDQIYDTKPLNEVEDQEE
jgi:hypothetical protein